MALAAWLALLPGAVPAAAQPAPPPAADMPAPPPAGDMPARGETPPVDYARPEAWLCRPGVDDGSCSAGLDALAVDAAGTRSPVAYAPARDPAIDCFYVYPTASHDPTIYSDMNAGPEERHAVHSQAARLGARCRLFAPIYHQYTGTALGWAMRHPGGLKTIDFGPSYLDILAAWKSYLARDNHGRGVVLIGHSQGAILLKRLIAEEIDGKPAQARLVAAYLAGNPDLTDRSFAHLPPCARPDQTGCVVAWSTYLEGQEARHFFGATPTGGNALCVDPAAPGGGRALLKAYLPKPARAPAGDPPYVETIGQLSATCLRDAGGAVLAVRVEPGRYADLLRQGLERASSAPGWGLHPLDVNIVQGNILDLIGTQAAAWAKRH